MYSVGGHNPNTGIKYIITQNVKHVMVAFISQGYVSGRSAWRTHELDLVEGLHETAGQV